MREVNRQKAQLARDWCRGPCHLPAVHSISMVTPRGREDSRQRPDGRRPSSSASLSCASSSFPAQPSFLGAETEGKTLRGLKADGKSTSIHNGGIFIIRSVLAPTRLAEAPPGAEEADSDGIPVRRVHVGSRPGRSRRVSASTPGERLQRSSVLLLVASEPGPCPLRAVRRRMGESQVPTGHELPLERRQALRDRRAVRVPGGRHLV